MRFEWDTKKQFTNIRKHGIDFEDVFEILSGDTLMMEDDRFVMVNGALSLWVFSEGG